MSWSTQIVPICLVYYSELSKYVILSGILKIQRSIDNFIEGGECGE